MESNKYIIRYTNTFIKQFNNILKYFIYKLQNKTVAESFYNEVIKEIEKRSGNPESFEKYNSSRKRNYTIFYVVRNNTMEIRRILYSRRNFDNLI